MSSIDRIVQVATALCLMLLLVVLITVTLWTIQQVTRLTLCLKTQLKRISKRLKSSYPDHYCDKEEPDNEHVLLEIAKRYKQVMLSIETIKEQQQPWEKSNNEWLPLYIAAAKSEWYAFSTAVKERLPDQNPREVYDRLMSVYDNNLDPPGLYDSNDDDS